MANYRDGGMYQNFDIPIINQGPTGWEAMNQSLGQATNSFTGIMLQQKMAEEEQKQRLGYLLAQQQMEQQNYLPRAMAEQQAKSQFEDQSLENTINQINRYPHLFGMGGGQPQAQPIAMPPQGPPQITPMGAAPGQMMNPIMQGQAPAARQPSAGNMNKFVFLINPGTGKLERVENQEFKLQQEAGQQTRKNQNDLEMVKQKQLLEGPNASEIGKVTLAKEALTNIQDVKKLLFPDGTPQSFKRTTAFASNVPGGSFPGMPSRLWGTAEQEIFRKMGTALSGRQLIQTGVAARPEETVKLISQFSPSAGSDPQAAFNGLTQLEDFYQSYLDQANPEDRYKKQGQQAGQKQLDRDTAAQFLKQAGGDKEKARQMARDQGYTF